MEVPAALLQALRCGTDLVSLDRELDVHRRAQGLPALQVGERHAGRREGRASAREHAGCGG